MTLQIYKITSVEVGSAGASSIDFTSIPQGYRDLLIVHSSRVNDASISSDIVVQFNGDTGANYSFRRLNANGASVTSDAGSSNALYGIAGVVSGTTATASTFGNVQVYIPNYTTSTAKSFSYDSVQENNATNAYCALGACIWTGTAAISSIKLRSYTGTNILQYSKATLYGIL